MPRPSATELYRKAQLERAQAAHGGVNEVKKRGRNIPIASDTMSLVWRIRVCQALGKAFERGRNSYLTSGLITFAMQNRLEEVCRGLKRYKSVDDLGWNTTRIKRAVAEAWHKVVQRTRGRPPTIEQWLREFQRENPGHRIDIRTFRWIAGQTGYTFLRIRKVK